jgi:hypothetical protein
MLLLNRPQRIRCTNLKSRFTTILEEAPAPSTATSDALSQTHAAHQKKRDYQKLYHFHHKARIQEQKKNYELKNKEKRKQYLKENQERIKEYKRQYALATKEKRREYLVLNREWTQAKKREYYLKNFSNFQLYWRQKRGTWRVEEEGKGGRRERRQRTEGETR